MYRIAVVGDKDSIYGFAALGLDIVTIEPNEEPLAKIKKVCSGEYAVVYITEALAAIYDKELALYKESQIPAIIPIPGITGNNGIGIASVKRSVEKAVGSDIIFND